MCSARRQYVCSCQTIRNLVARRKAAGRLLGEREAAVDANFEDAAARAPQVQLRRGLQLEDQILRLTGARFVASLAAIFDFDVHDLVLTA
jgi:hypothetical protein